MNYVLLLGAGFSRNWGGWLADEVFEYLLGHSDVANDYHLKTILWKHKKSGGFEEALAEIQHDTQRNSKESEERLGRLENAITKMFDDMNKSFERETGLGRGIQALLAQFDAIFTLNQDLLLEGHYTCGSGLSSSPYAMSTQLIITPGSKWEYWHTPGVMHPDVKGAPHPKQIYENKWTPAGEKDFAIEGRKQPYFKLHGSSNWRTQDGNQLLIMGGNKEKMIKSYAVLSWYHEQFEEFISRPETRLMIIGYSFRDVHINNMLISAAEKGNLRLFIIDPIGVDAIGLGNRTRNAAIYCPDKIEETLHPCVIGASRRPLRDTFADNNAELKKIARFFS